ncbi:peptidoglycan DD-metalloendopeptidase family protein [Tropicimonas sp. IMCC34011]|uniref:peptidoglycan DD-metalloendopeptidase family protein n=1 Tax=Tropicimonas sp. IMCC34011 TaxID=2248759 RepID=UPI000E267B15|nr:peptidoglycan DD-metalloendopeptidase family protein [Tropicimonas sp. IMCC34011]
MDEVDPRFREHRKRAKVRKRRRGLGRLVLPVGVPLLALGVVGGGLALTWDQWSFGSTDVHVEEDELDVDLVALEQEVAQTSAAFAAAFIDLAGDPMLIRLAEDGGSSATRNLPVPQELDAARVGAALVMVSDVMVSQEESFITTLPSSQEDFAFFQSQRFSPPGGDPIRPELDEGAAVQAAAQNAAEAPGSPLSAEETDFDEGGGWGESIDDAGREITEFTETRIENTTSVAFVRDEAERQALSEDIFVRISAPRGLAELMEDRGFAEAEAAAVSEAAQALWGVEELASGQVVALRGVPGEGGGLGFAQLSLYDEETYFGTLARAGDGGIVEGSDPWVDDELFDYAEGQEAEGSLEQKYRMLDAFYSTAIRNRVPAVLVGEAIALLSKSHDLDAFANPGDRMSILYSPERLEEDTGAGQILHIAIRGEDVDVECFVYRTAPGQEYSCYDAVPRAGGGSAGGGMVTPVKGVLTSRFGPRTHPVLGTVRVHNGVDWAAPTGTPIHAAFAGTVSYAGDGGGYGNVVKISHPGGFETRYAHMSRFGVQSGQAVNAGDVVGYVGTTGLSTGPHLHFELYLSGKPIDPLSTSGPVAGGGGGGGAVEALVNQIIRVESAGNARAKNKLSTATGLGQFIESTWIRMMQTYRPDLVASLSRAELLDLRFDPTISREMVTNLAREGESYLRARGHHITAGRLYLCHFLGAAGAHQVLSAPDDAALVAVLGQPVIGANPFLRGRNVAYVKAWAEKKMSGSGAPVVTASAPVVAKEPDGLEDFRAAIKTVLTAG